MIRKMYNERCRTKILTILTVVILFGGAASAVIEFNDGGYHLIDYVVDDFVSVDYGVPAAGTRLDIISGGNLTEGVSAFGTSHLLMDGGISAHLNVLDNASLTMYSGTARDIRAEDRSTAEVLGGEVYLVTTAGNATNVFIHGGSIELIVTWDNSGLWMGGGFLSGEFRVYSNSLITLEGTGFEVNGYSVGEGAFASTWATPGIDPWGNSCLTGTVTGVLAAGDVINNPFVLYQGGDITLIPEPATFLILLFGSMLMKKRH
jgi:hypothetical protein